MNTKLEIWTMNLQNGFLMYELAKRLFKIPRSITGNGVRETLSILQETCSHLKIYEIPTGTSAFDWEVPKEWNIFDAWIKAPDGKKIIDFKENNLHVVGYSLPIHGKIGRDELLAHVYTLPENPGWIPYMTSYYKERWGFCMSELQKASLKDSEYEVLIDSELNDGSLTYGEIMIPGETEREIFLSTYICHPQMANNELSGPCVTIHLAKWLSERQNRYTYRIAFVPETIGSIVYLSRNIERMKDKVEAGFVITCVGDTRAYSYLESPYANTLADRAARNILKHHAPDYKIYSFLERGSDERQYCSAGVRLPVCSVMRSKYGEYPEYHTSADDLELISAEGLEGSFELYRNILLTLENNRIYKIKNACEPQLGKRGLYPTLSTKESKLMVADMMNFITYADGENDLIGISDITGTSVEKLSGIANNLVFNGVCDYITQTSQELRVCFVVKNTKTSSKKS
jgi:aminopeptidase-like protein